MANVLAVFAHPDDEVLGCGGTLAKHAENGDDVRIVYGTHDRVKEHIAAAEVLGASSSWKVIGFPDQKADTIPILEITKTIESFQYPDPDVIYTHHPDDLNLDHALTARAVLTAFRPKPDENPRTILACEVPSSTEYTYPRRFNPNWYVSLTPQQLDRKIEALKCYETELCEFPHPRSAIGVRNVAAVRGQEVGVASAEAFQCLRVVR